MNVECWEVDSNGKMEELSHSIEMSTFRGAPVKVAMFVRLYVGLHLQFTIVQYVMIEY